VTNFICQHRLELAGFQIRTWLPPATSSWSYWSKVKWDRWCSERHGHWWMWITPHPLVHLDL